MEKKLVVSNPILVTKFNNKVAPIRRRNGNGLLPIDLGYRQEGCEERVLGQRRILLTLFVATRLKMFFKNKQLPNKIVSIRRRN